MSDSGNDRYKSSQVKYKVLYWNDQLVKYIMKKKKREKNGKDIEKYIPNDTLTSKIQRWMYWRKYDKMISELRIKLTNIKKL